MAAVLGNVSTLLIQESDLLLGVQAYFEEIEDLLSRKSSSEYTDQEELSHVIRNIEDAITDLMIISDNRWKRHAFLHYCMAFVGGQQKNLFFVMLSMHLIEYFKLVQRLSDISNQMRTREFDDIIELGGSFYESPPYKSNTVISRAITQCEALAVEHRLNPTIKRQAKWLCEKFNSFQHLLKDVDMEELSRRDVAWIDEVFDVCSSANDTVTLFLRSLQHRQKKKVKELLRSTNWCFCFPNLNSKNMFAKQLAQIRDHVQDVAVRKPQLVATPVLLRDKVRRLALAHPAGQLDLISFDEDVDAITEKLLVEDNRCITISILGISGIGKKSLAKLVYSNAAIEHHFPLRLWVSEANEMEINRKILGIGGCLDYHQTVRMANTVFADKRFLIVVENSCAYIWRQMGHVFRSLFNGSRIIFMVTNVKEAEPISKTNFNYRMHLRTDDESWALFMNTLKLNISSQLQKDMKGQILRKCGGLPRAIANLAKLLSRREATLGEWSRVLEQLNQDQEPWSQILEEIDKCVPLYLRRCLFYFGLFPANYNIPARRLINLWIAEGLVSENADGRNVKSFAEKYLEELTNLGMVHVTERKPNGKIKTCSLPEAIRLHWITKAKETNFIQGQSNIAHGIRRVADHVKPDDAIFQHIHGNNSHRMYHCYRNTVSFLSFDRREAAGTYVGNFLERCISKNCFFFLLVLDLERVYRPKLPKPLRKLTHLRYLGLRWTHLHNLPMFINKLLSLNTLDLKGTCIDTLPASIWKMEQLRHLFLDQSSRTIFLPPLQESFLQDLQTLWGLFIDERSPVKNGLDKLQFIRKLGLKSKVSVASQKDAMSSQLVAVENWVMNLKCLQMLRLKSFDELEQPWDLHLDSLLDHTDLSIIYLAGKLKNQQLVTKFPHNVIELTLSASRLVDDPMQALEKLPNLKILRLYSKSYTGERMVCSSKGFPKLKMLKLWELEHLEAWEMEEGSLSQLKDLEIRRCMQLKMLPDGLKNIKTLRKVKLTQLPLVSPRVKDISGEDWIKIAHVLDVCIED